MSLPGLPEIAKAAHRVPKAIDDLASCESASQSEAVLNTRGISTICLFG